MSVAVFVEASPPVVDDESDLQRIDRKIAAGRIRTIPLRILIDRLRIEYPTEARSVELLLDVVIGFDTRIVPPMPARSDASFILFGVSFELLSSPLGQRQSTPTCQPTHRESGECRPPVNRLDELLPWNWNSAPTAVAA
jgi:hypothetical protein